jgi:creatinine amidohydrolase
VASVAANGVLGDPAGASAAEGRELLARLVDDLVDAVATWAGAPV